ncbi:MAG: SDR family oxidoreductase [Patescibacteria group bacterium]
MSKTYILTGGTGFLGSLLSIELIKKGNKVIFLGRSKNNEDFETRIIKKLKSIDNNVNLNNVETLEFELSKEDNSININATIDAIWHLAANLSFKEADRTQVLNTNINGLKNILKISEQKKVPVFYTSTAYVHGQRPGLIYEHDLIKPKKFNNPYEESKYKAENIIKEWGRKGGNDFIIFRPSILIEENRRTVSFFGYYAVVYALNKMRINSGKEDLKISIPIPYSKDTLLNLMPTERAIEWMLEISSKKDALGKTFHITNPRPFSMKTIFNQTMTATRVKFLLIGLPRYLVKFIYSLFYYLSFVLPPLRGIAKRFYYYKYYMSDYNIYDMTNTKKFLPAGGVEKLQFPENYIYKIARDFIEKLEKTNKQL